MNADTLSPVATSSDGWWVGVIFDDDLEGPVWHCPHHHPDLDSAEECANAYIEELSR